jgi:type IV pilus assembly protein PilW
LQALYGKDTTGNGSVDTYDRTTPDTVPKWGQLRSIRLAIVARSAQYEKEPVTITKPLWDVGSTATVNGVTTTACASSKCITLDVKATVSPASDEWQHYRYKVFDTVIPIKNMLWNN